MTYKGLTIDRDEVYMHSQRVHHRVQGSGSGVDIAAAVYGGMLTFQAGTVRKSPSLPLVAVWSGSSAKTGPRVQQYQRWSCRETFVDTMTQLVDNFFDAPVQSLAAGTAALSQMAEQANVPYWTPALRTITALAESYGGAAKPSGAGGGDCSVAIFDSDANQKKFVDACTARGFSVIPVNIAAGVAGVNAEPS